MNILKKFLGFILAILFISTAVPALFLFNFDRRAFTAEMYQKTFATDDFYDKLPGIMAEAVVSRTADENQFPIVLRGMSQDAWEAFFRSVLPQETLKQMGDDILTSTFAYLNRKTTSVQLSLTPLKISLVSDTGVQAVFTLLKTQPDCTLLQIGQMTLNLFTKNELQLCNPPEEIVPLLTPVIQGQMQVVSLAIPDQITLASAPLENDPRVKLQTARLLMRLSPIIPLALLMLMTIFAVNSLKNWLGWWGIPFFITGGVASVVSLSGAPIFGAILQRILVDRMPAYLPTILLDYTSDLAAAMLKSLLTPVLWQGLVIALVGFVMALASFFIKSNQQKP